MTKKYECVVCDHISAIELRDVETPRSKKLIKQYHCLDCKSFFNPSGYVESDEDLKEDLKWNLGVTERNEINSRKLISKLLHLFPNCENILEIGCGTGTTLRIAKDEFGKSIEGYDVNPEAIKYSQQTFGLNVFCTEWSSQTSSNADLILCISVLEHISHPRGLIKELALAAKEFNCPLYISVPFVEKYQWYFADDKFKNAAKTPFFDNDVHVTHFSFQGLTVILSELGFSSYRIIKCGIWWGVLFYPDPSKWNKLENRMINAFWKIYFESTRLINWRIRGLYPQWLKLLNAELNKIT